MLQLHIQPGGGGEREGEEEKEEEESLLASNRSLADHDHEGLCQITILQFLWDMVVLGQTRHWQEKGTKKDSSSAFLNLQER